jgi:hypothetical protein
MSSGIPNSTIRTSYGLVIEVGGVSIGMIQTWNPQQSRTITPVYQLGDGILQHDGYVSAGGVVENVPGNIGGLTLSISRFDMFRSRMEQVWGIADMEMLTDQKNEIVVKESWTDPQGLKVAYNYQGFWFTSLGRTVSATDSRIVNVSASASYVRRVKTN